MASLKAIRTATKTTLEANLAGVMVHRTIPGGVNSTAIVVRPSLDQTADFHVAMARGTDTWNLELLVLASTADIELGQDELDDYIAGAGAKSIRAVVFANRTLGLSDGTDAHVSGVTGYGTYEVGAAQHVGAILPLIVHTPGTE